MKIDDIKLNRLRNNAHFQFHADNIKFVEEHTPQALKIEAPHQEYLALHANVDAALKDIAKSGYTDPIREADKARDETWKGLLETSKAALKHADPVIREAARQIKIVTDTYGKSKLARLPLIDQTSAITNLVQDLEGPYAQYVRDMGLVAWLVELKARNITVANLMRDRIDEASQKVDTVLKEARAKLDDKFYEIRELINARVVVEGPANYDPYIKKLNANIAKYKILVNASKRGKKGKKAAGSAQNNGGSL